MYINILGTKIDPVATFCFVVLVFILLEKIDVRKYTNVYERKGFIPPKFLIYVGVLSAFFCAFFLPNLVGK
jgi:hypothetical protein